MPFFQFVSNTKIHTTWLFTGKGNNVNNCSVQNPEKGILKGLKVPIAENFFKKIRLKYKLLTTYLKNTLLLKSFYVKKKVSVFLWY